MKTASLTSLHKEYNFLTQQRKALLDSRVPAPTSAASTNSLNKIPKMTIWFNPLAICDDTLSIAVLPP